MCRTSFSLGLFLRPLLGNSGESRRDQEHARSPGEHLSYHKAVVQRYPAA